MRPDQTATPGGSTDHEYGSRFDAVTPQDTRSAGPVDDAVLPSHAVPYRPDPPRPGEVPCPRCGRGVPQDRRFCRCGASLTPADTLIGMPAATADAPVDRLNGRAFRKAMRSANGGLRVGYNAALSARAQLFRVTLALGMCAAVLSQVGPWGADLRGQVYQRVQRVLPQRFVDIHVENATTDPAGHPIAGYDVSYAVDGRADRAWAAPVQKARPGDKPCGRPGVAPALLITFNQETVVDRMVIRAGLAGDNNDRALQSRPRTIDLLFPDGTCQTATLDDKPDAQVSKLGVASAARVRLTIVDVFRPEDQGDGLVSLSEVTFQRRK